MITLKASDDLKDPQRHWAYNGLDCCATLGAGLEMLRAVEADPAVAMVYEAERKLCAPSLAVQMRGILVDEEARAGGAQALRAAMDEVERQVQTMVGDPSLNIQSPAQLKALFYGEKMGLAPMRNTKGDTSTDRSVLERIADNQALTWARPKAERPTQGHVQEVARKILEHRDLAKQRQVYMARLHGGRMRCTISVGSTETWRFSCTHSPLGDGRNLQNIKKRERAIFVPDPGFTLWQMDQKTAESMTVAYLSGDPAYIAAHHTHDTHVHVAQICYPNLDWPDDPAAQQQFARHRANLFGFAVRDDFSLRDLFKRIQHSLNYLGTYHTVSRTLHIPERTAADIVDRYYGAFPGIPAWHQQVIQQIKEERVVHYPGGYKRIVLGRPNDPATHREIIASFGQSIIGWVNHSAFSLIWHELDRSFLPGDLGPDLQVLLPVHDAILFQTRREDLAHRAHDLASTITWPMPEGRTMQVPWTMKSGPNWEACS